MKQEERPLEWIGSSHKDLMQLPADVRKSVGFALHFAQHGEQHPASKVLKSVYIAPSRRIGNRKANRAGLTTGSERTDRWPSG